MLVNRSVNFLYNVFSIHQGRIKGWAQGAGAPGHPPKRDKRGHPPDKSNCTHREMRLLIRAETRTV